MAVIRNRLGGTSAARTGPAEEEDDEAPAVDEDMLANLVACTQRPEVDCRMALRDAGGNAEQAVAMLLSAAEDTVEVAATSTAPTDNGDGEAESAGGAEGGDGRGGGGPALPPLPSRAVF